MPEPPASTTYSFGRRSGGLLLGLDGFGLLVAGCGALVVVVVFVVGGLVAAAGAAVLAAAVTWAPSWGGPPVRDVARRLCRLRVARARGRAADHATRSVPPATASALPPGPWPDGISVADISVAGRAVISLGNDEYAGVWRVVGPRDAALTSAAEQERDLAAWGAALDALAGIPTLRRLQWLVVTVPDPAAEPQAWITEHVDPTAPPALRADYVALLEALGSTARRRDVLIVAVVRPRRSAADAAAQDLDAGVGRQLAAAGVSAERLDARSVAGVIGEAADPERDAISAAIYLRGFAPAPLAPVRWEETATTLAAGVSHRTLVVSELLRVPGPPDWLWPLLAAQVPSAKRLAVACHLVPVPAWRAQRSAESAVTSAESEMRRRERAGFSTRSRDVLALDAQAQREHEVAAGHATYRVTVTITVSATSDQALRMAADEALAAIHRARCAAHRGLGVQLAGWRASLPLGLVPRVERAVATTRAVRSLWPAQVACASSGGGVVIGSDALSGAAWAFDPWAAYAAGAITTPSLAIVGQVGRGKSSLAKALASREAGLVGRRLWIIDPKGEYLALADTLDLPVISLRPGGSVRVNPLDVPADLDPAEAARRRAGLAAVLAAAELARPLGPEERVALDAVCAALPAAPTLADVVALLLEPPAELAAGLATTSGKLASRVRDLGLALHGLVAGRLAGMFDGPSTVRLAERGGVIDLCGVFADPASLPPILAASIAWISSAMAGGGAPGLLVVDEAWQVMGAGGVDFLRATAKLARAFGVGLVLLMHRLADLAAAGDDGSAVARRAEGLFSDVETVFAFGQAAEDAAILGQALGLSEREIELLPTLPRGRCLAIVGHQHSLLDVQLTWIEAALADTDAAMRAR